MRSQAKIEEDWVSDPVIEKGKGAKESEDGKVEVGKSVRKSNKGATRNAGDWYV